ncbi:hypothetical protein AB4Y95_16350 [Arthrobacter sp. M-10]
MLEGITAWVEEVMVAGQVRRQGVGQALMTEAELWGGSKALPMSL